MITYSHCIDGYMLAIRARRLSERTIESYEVVLRRFGEYLGNDPPLADISPTMVRSFLASLQVSKKTMLNYHWGWTCSYGVESGRIRQRIRFQVSFGG